MDRGLTEKQRQILDFIVERVEEHGAPPTLREIGEKFHFGAVRSAQSHLQALEQKGYIRRLPGKSRGIELVREKLQKYRRPGIPLVGHIAAGRPINAEADIQEFIRLDVLFPTDEGPFALRVQGDSMIGAGILEGDLVVVQPRTTVAIGEIVVALINNDEATVKYLGRDGEKLALFPANSEYPPIPIENAQVVGRVVGVIRRLKSPLQRGPGVISRA
jgi:repressor LexA